MSTRSQFADKVKKLAWGFVDGEVVIKLPGGLEMTGIIFLAGVNRLHLEQAATAMVKASCVVVAVKK